MAPERWKFSSELADIFPASKNHTVFTPNACPFPEAQNTYRDIRDIYKLLRSVDAIFMIVDGLFYSYETLSILPTLLSLHKPVVWLLNAPIEESLITPGHSLYSYPIDKFSRRVFSSFVDVCICISPVMESYAKRHLLAKKHVVIPNGSDPTFIQPQMKRVFVKKKNKKIFNIIWAGSGYYTWHAIDVINRVAEIFARKDPSVIFTMVTDPPWYPLSRLPNFRIVGPKDYAHVKEELINSDLALCLYHTRLSMGFYNSPLKLFEAMSAGLPVIATDIGQIHDIIVDKQNGFLTRNDPEHIVSIIESVKKNSTLARQIGINARKSITIYYNWDRMVKEINSVLYRFGPFFA